MNEQKIKEIFADESFVKELFSKQTPEEAQQVFASKGIDLTIDEVKKFGELVQKRADGELTDEELSDVAGGVLGVVGWLLVGWMAGNCVVATGALLYMKRLW